MLPHCPTWTSPSSCFALSTLYDHLYLRFQKGLFVWHTRMEEYQDWHRRQFVSQHWHPPASWGALGRVLCLPEPQHSDLYNWGHGRYHHNQGEDHVTNVKILCIPPSLESCNLGKSGTQLTWNLKTDVQVYTSYTFFFSFAHTASIFKTCLPFLQKAQGFAEAELIFLTTGHGWTELSWVIYYLLQLLQSFWQTVLFSKGKEMCLWPSQV